MFAPFDWAVSGARLGETLDHVHAIAVLGSDPEATANVALAIGRAQARRRRVAVGDLLGESHAIQSLVAREDAHGIVDSFVYGVSLNRIAYPVAGEADLYVMPTGTEPVDGAEIFPSARWRRLASGFREVGALLVLAARVDEPAIEALVAQLDGAVLVGETVPTNLPVAAVISTVRVPMLSGASSKGTPTPTSTPVIIPLGAPESQPRVTPGRFIAAGVGLMAIGAIGIWLASRPLDDSVSRPITPPRDTAALATVLPNTAPVASSDSLAPGVRAVDTLAVPPAVANPADSAAAAAYSVEVLATNTAAGAAARLREDGAAPAATFAPALVDGAAWYKVVSGAYATRAPADSLLRALRARRRLDARSGSVVQLPYAFLLHARVPADSVRPIVGAYADLGQPAYALRQADGRAHVYVGAYESPIQAALHIASLRAAGVTPTLVFRTGRVF